MLDSLGQKGHGIFIGIDAKEKRKRLTIEGKGSYYGEYN